MITRTDKNNIYIKTNPLNGSKLSGTYSKATGEWRLPYNLGTLRELYALGIDKVRVQTLGSMLRSRYLAIDELKVKEFGPLKASGLRSYQLEDVNFIVNRPYAGIFNQQRTGKTPTTIKALEVIGGKTIIIAPASLVLNWVDEIKRWSSLVPVAYAGSKTKRLKTLTEPFDVIVTTVGMVKSDFTLLQQLKVGTIVVDEAHFLRNYKTAQSKAVFELAYGIGRRYALTGTPAVKHPSDMYGILHFLDPNKWTSYWQFTKRYFDVVEGYFGGFDIKNFTNDERKVEFEEIVNVISIQRKRADVMKWLPEKQYQTIELDMEQVQRANYNSMLDNFFAEDADLDASGVLAQLTRLRQLSSVPEVFDLPLGPKAKFINEWLDNNHDEQLVVFSNFTSGLVKLKEWLCPKGKNIGMITGQQTKKERDYNVKKFQSGKLRVLLCNIEAAGVGLTLDKAGTVIFLDRHYNPAQNEQAEDRIVATTEGSNNSALIIDLVCRDSIDYKILEIVKNKRSITEVVNNYKNLKDWLS